MIEFELALRLTEILLGVALIQSSAEHLITRDRVLFALRFGLSGLLIAGVAIPWVLGGLFVTCIVVLHRFNGAYNGGSDKMSLLILTCLGLAHVAPSVFWEELALSYLAVQLVLSYFISGWVKLRRSEWRSGTALCDVFRFSAYPVSEQLRGLANHPRTLCAASWGVMLFEVAFPLSLSQPRLLTAALVVAAMFHLSNAFLFGLNRFFWSWLAAYPALIWFQGRVVLTGLPSLGGLG